MPETPSVLVIGGPTASGKTGLALALAEKCHGVIINADSLQLYKDLPILTARPTPEEAARAPHRLFGVLGPSETCSAARWRALATQEIRQALDDGKRPVLVGGTGFYLLALMQGMSPVPDVPEEVRARLALDTAGMDGRAIHDLLAGRDPVMAARLVRGDRQRCLRALEVLAHTGQSLAVFQDMPREGAPEGLTFEVVVLDPSRDVLYARCDSRFDLMMKAGAVDEVAALLASGVSEDASVFRALGARQIADGLAGRMPMEEAVRDAKADTRHYAKRQATWFRHQLEAGNAIRNVTRLAVPEEGLALKHLDDLPIWSLERSF
ncbi:MAG TPA: tRNA (adenosine(37)-N6)-dimethylallyltransferase MiaA [Rhodospirillaceae bacterium]|nr:tRNA (adenosine(37)-N6)-dimethylallyltransferase MiaA [Rhodospirillaceae bacterium]